jgi:probable F420-dependent oxidoreductase
VTRTGVRIGVHVQPQHASFAELRRVAMELDESGVDTFFVSDHFRTVPGPPDGKIFECWTTLAALAEATSRVALGPLVTCTSYRNANLIADMARTLDHVSGGRMILGLGAGWFEPDYDAYGYRFGTPAERVAAFGAALVTVTERLPRLNPPPVQARIPILVGGGGERKMLRLVAAHADVWNAQCDPATFRRKNEVLDRHCEALGRPPAEVERSVLMTQSGQHELAGDYLAAGATHLILGAGRPPWNLSALRELIEWRAGQRSSGHDRPALLGRVEDVWTVDVEGTEMAVRFRP